MPPRRPGGKYRGAVSRQKADSTLEKEYEEGRSRQLHKYLVTQEQKKAGAEREKLAAQLQMDADGKEVSKQVVAYMLGSKKTDLRASFQKWILGMQAVRHEKEVNKRNMAWRSACGNNGPDDRACSCNDDLFCNVHKSRWFRMPYDLKKEAKQKQEEQDRLDAIAREAMKQIPLPPLPGLGADRLMRKSGSLTSLGSGKHMISRWPCRCAECRNAGDPDPEFIDVKNATMHVHFKSGRRCFLDQSTMRFYTFEATKSHALFGTSLI